MSPKTLFKEPKKSSFFFFFLHFPDKIQDFTFQRNIESDSWWFSTWKMLDNPCPFISALGLPMSQPYYLSNNGFGHFKQKYFCI